MMLMFMKCKCNYASLTPRVLQAVLDYNKPTSSMAFRPLEETKAVGVDPTDLAKTVRIGTQLPAK